MMEWLHQRRKKHKTDLFQEKPETLRYIRPKKKKRVNKIKERILYFRIFRHLQSVRTMIGGTNA